MLIEQERHRGPGARGPRCRRSGPTAVPPYRRTAVTPLIALSALLGAVSLVPNPAFGQASHRTLTIGRLHYDGGGDWYANPSSLPNLLEEVGRRTALRVTDREQVVTSGLLYLTEACRERLPLIMATTSLDRSARQMSRPEATGNSAPPIIIVRPIARYVRRS